jgi:hypothetical protein
MKQLPTILQWLYCTGLVAGLGSCAKEAGTDNRINVNFSNGAVQVINDSTARFAARLYINTPYDRNQLAASNFVSYDTTVLGIGNGTINTTYTVHKISERVVTGTTQPVSILILVDKSVTGLINVINYQQFYANLTSYLQGQSGYEIALAGFAAGNPNMAAYQSIGHGFSADIVTAEQAGGSSLFNLQPDGGNPNLVEALDSGLEFMNSQAAYGNRAILVVTTPNSDDRDTAAIAALAAKAIAYHTSLNFYYVPETYDYSALKLASNTGGLVCDIVSNGTYLQNFNVDLFIPAFFQYWTTGDYYEWVTEIRTSSPFFNHVTWALFDCPATTYDTGSADIKLFYEE